MLTRAFPFAVLVLLTGCGFAMRGPPRGHAQMTQFKCSASKVPPAADLIGTAVVALLIDFVNSDGSARDGEWAPLLPLTFATSAIVGFRKASKCRAATRELEARLARQR